MVVDVDAGVGFEGYKPDFHQFRINRFPPILRALRKSVETLFHLHHKLDSVLVGGFETGCRLNVHLFLDVNVEESSLHVKLVYFQVQLSSDRKPHPDALNPANRSIGSTAVSTMNSLVPALRH